MRGIIRRSFGQRLYLSNHCSKTGQFVGMIGGQQIGSGRQCCGIVKITSKLFGKTACIGLRA